LKIKVDFRENGKIEKKHFVLLIFRGDPKKPDYSLILLVEGKLGTIIHIP
jgi:hypothetical protein